MKTLPEGLEVYRRTADFDEDSVPNGLLRAHSTKSGVWGRIRVEAGRLRYRILADEARGEAEWETVLEPGRDGVVEPERLHEVEPVGRVRFHVQFLREPKPEGDVG